MKEKRIICILVIMMLFTTSSLVSANADIKVVLDGKQISFDVPPTVINNRTMVPVRAIFESMDATVEWNEETQTVTSYKDDTKIKLKLNDNCMSVNDKKVILDVPATSINYRTLVPVRAISEAFGCEVLWDESTQTVNIKSKTESKVDVPKQNMVIDYDSYMENIEEKIDVGYDNAAIVDSKSNLFVWGNNKNGNFPINKEVITKPLLIKEGVTKAVIGNDFALFLYNDGSVTQCKNKTEQTVSFPNTIIDIDCGYNHCLALDKDGNVYGWGKNTENSLVAGSVEYINSPQKLLTNVEKMSAFEDKSVFLLKNNMLIATKPLELSSNGNARASKLQKDVIEYITPFYDGVMLFQIKSAVDDFTYDNSVLKIVSEQNTIYMFPQSYAFYGKNEKEFDYSKFILEKDAYLRIVNSDLYVNGSVSNYNFKNIKLMNDVKYVKSLKCGAFLVVLNDGSVWTFGNNENYALGDGKKTNSYYPATILALFPELSESDMDPLEISVLSSDDYTDGYNINVQFKDSSGNIVTPCGLAMVEIYSLGESIYHENIYLTEKSYKNQIATIILPSHKVKSYSKNGEISITFKDSYTLSDAICSITNLPEDDITLSDVIDVIKDYISDIQYDKTYTLTSYNYFGQPTKITQIDGFKITDVKISYSDNLRVWCNIRGKIIGSDNCIISARCYDADGYVVAAPLIVAKTVSDGEEFYLEDYFYVPIGTKRIELFVD